MLLTQRLFLLNRHLGDSISVATLHFTISHGAKAWHQNQGFNLALICQDTYLQKQWKGLWMVLGRMLILADVVSSERVWQQPCPASLLKLFVR